MGVIGWAQRFKHLSATPANPPTGESSMYFKTDGGLYVRNALGAEKPVTVPDSALHPNPDFELGATAPGTDWTTFWTSGATWSSDTTTAIEGARSAKCVSTSAGDTIRVGTNGTFVVVPGQTIRFSTWAKASVAGQLEISLFTSTPAGNPDWFGSEYTQQSGFRSVGTGWVRYEATFTVPTGHTKARIYFSLESNRTWWLDASGSVVTAQAPTTYFVDWTTLTLSGSWVHFDARTAQYMRTADGWVKFRGLIKLGGNSQFTAMPVGFRPEARVPFEHHFPVAANAAFGLVRAGGSDGAMDFLIGNDTWVDLSTVTYRAVI